MKDLADAAVAPFKAEGFSLQQAILCSQRQAGGGLPLLKLLRQGSLSPSQSVELLTEIKGSSELKGGRRDSAVRFSETISVYNYVPTDPHVAPEVYVVLLADKEAEALERPRLQQPELALKPVDFVPSNLSFPWSNDKYQAQMALNRPVMLVNLVRKRLVPATNSHRVAGQILVKNLAFDKTVFVRWTTDNWCTYRECPAVYTVSASSQKADPTGFDIFCFAFLLDGHECQMEADAGSGRQQRVTVMQLAVCYRVDGEEHWDNNQGCNYSVCLTGNC